MVYRFSESIDEVLEDGIVFTADNGVGEVKNGILCISNDKNVYTYENDQWHLNDFPCGTGAVPVLELLNLQIVNENIFSIIIYTAIER